MQNPDTIVVSAQLRELVRNMCDRLGAVRVLAAPAWQGFAIAAGLGELDTAVTSAAGVVVGLPAAVLKHAASATRDFGFVAPVAQEAARWQRAERWRDDLTLQLWHIGWTPLAIDRVLVPVDNATLEFVIGNARPTPPSP